MDKPRICRICNRRFANGKAMGGHMRSHLAKLPLPPKPISHQPKPPDQNPSPPPPPLLLISSSSSSLNCGGTSSENPIFQSHRSANNELPFKPNFSTLYDGESDTDQSPRNPTRKRSKRRRRKSPEKAAESILKAGGGGECSEQVSTSTTVSEFVFSEEDAAMCLLMLSRDYLAWTKYVLEKGKAEVNKCVTNIEPEDENYVDVDVEVDDDDELFRASRGGVQSNKAPSSSMYRCELCNKCFPSYQSLGGHKASHKKIKTHTGNNLGNEEGAENCGYTNSVGAGAGTGTGVGVSEQRIFKCPFCDKVFESGQALGGHKKVHFAYLGTVKISPNNKSNDCALLDLNLPAPEAIEDDDEIS